MVWYKSCPVLKTWKGVLKEDATLPDNWIKNTRVLVSIEVLRPAGCIGKGSWLMPPSLTLTEAQYGHT